jgi:hypothetical protein
LLSELDLDPVVVYARNSEHSKGCGQTNWPN